MHSQIDRKHHGSLLERYLGAARRALRRAVAPLDVRQSTLNEDEQSLLRQLVEQYTEGRQFGFLGEPRVNVLALNLALDGEGR